MRFQLFECIIQRRSISARAYVVAPTREAAWLAVIEHEEALGQTHEDMTISRFDDRIGQELINGLDELLENAPVGFASFAGRWIAHTAPVQQLKLYRTIDDEGQSMYAIAPNVDVAATVLTRELRIPRGQVKLLHISDGMADLPDNMICNLPDLLEFGPIGIALYESDEKLWSVL